jgi:hypothetical protein
MPFATFGLYREDMTYEFSTDRPASEENRQRSDQLGSIVKRGAIALLQKLLSERDARQDARSFRTRRHHRKGWSLPSSEWRKCLGLCDANRLEDGANAGAPHRKCFARVPALAASTQIDRGHSE